MKYYYYLSMKIKYSLRVLILPRDTPNLIKAEGSNIWTDMQQLLILRSFFHLQNELFI